MSRRSRPRGGTRRPRRRRRTSVRRSRHGGRGLLERLQPFAADRKLEVGETGEVAAGSRQVRHEAAPERIGHLHTIGSVVDCSRSCESTGELLAMRSRRAQRPPPRPPRRASGRDRRSPSDNRCGGGGYRPSPGSRSPCSRAATRIRVSGSSGANGINTPTRCIVRRSAAPSPRAATPPQRRRAA